MLNKRSIQIIALLFIPLLMACPQQDEPNQQTPMKKTYKADSQGLKSLHSDLMSLIGNTSCQQSSDCALVAIGARACGGPDSYAVYSKNNVDINEVTALSERYTALKKVYNKTNQVVSICMVEPIPSVSCIQGQCAKGRGPTLIQ